MHPDVVTAQHTQTLTPFVIPVRRIRYEDLVDEFYEYTQVLLGREPSPVQSPYLDLMEVATVYHSRGREVEALIRQLEIEGEIRKGEKLYLFRTGPLSSFIEMARKCIDLGSRRLTQEHLLTRMRME